MVDEMNLWHGYHTHIISDMDELFKNLKLAPENVPYPLLDESMFGLSVSKEYMHAIHEGDWFDPLLLQVIPRREETICRDGFSNDPVGDGDALKAPGLLHKYASRCLMLVSGACPMHCRFCFRKAFSFAGIPSRVDAWEPAIEYIRRHEDIIEVIFSGGDPFVLENGYLKSLFDAVKGIRHVSMLRIHSRVPVALPDRIDKGLLAILRETSRSICCTVVLHANHARELGGKTMEKIRLLKGTGVRLLNQSVLLSGINDSAATLKDLSVALVRLGVMPYYLHQLDRVAGASHFEVDEAKGREIVTALRSQVPGYLVPRYVKELPGEPYKVCIE